jgi:LPS export ABC transporter protein LptC
MIRGLFLLSILVAAALPFAGCSRMETPRIEEGGDRLPLTEYRDTTILDMHDGSHMAWRLKTTHLVRWPGSELVHATPVELSVFDSTGAFQMRVTADSGAVDEPVNFLLAQGNVHGVSAKGMDLRTDSLRWSKTLNQVVTEAAVRVISENGDILTGRGFVSDANLDHWQILSDVQGVFQEAGARAGELDPVDGTSGGATADSAGASGGARGNVPAVGAKTAPGNVPGGTPKSAPKNLPKTAPLPPKVTGPGKVPVKPPKPRPAAPAVGGREALEAIRRADSLNPGGSGL